MSIKTIVIFFGSMGFALLAGCSRSGITRETLSFPSTAVVTTGSETARVSYNGSTFDVGIAHASGSISPQQIFDIQKQKILTQIDQVVWVGETQISNPCGGNTTFGQWKTGGKTFYGTVIGVEGTTYGVFAHDVSTSAYQEFLGLITCN